MVATFALAGGAWIFLGVIILVLVGIIFGYYTIRGSGISNTPYGKVYGGAPAAKSGDTLAVSQLGNSVMRQAGRAGRH